MFLKLLYFNICIFVKRFFVCLITTSTTVMMRSQLNPHQINMLIQYSLKSSVNQKLTKISDINTRKYLFEMDLRVVTLNSKNVFGHISTKYRISFKRAGPQTITVSNNNRHHLITAVSFVIHVKISATLLYMPPLLEALYL